MVGGSAKGGFIHHGCAEDVREMVGQPARAARNDPPYAGFEGVCRGVVRASTHPATIISDFRTYKL